MVNWSRWRPVWISMPPDRLRRRPFRLDLGEPDRRSQCRQNRTMSVSNGEPAISRQKPDSLCDTSQSQPGRSHRRTIKNMSSDIVDGGIAGRTSSGWSAQACGFGQRSRNGRAAHSDDGFPRPVAA